MSSAQRRGRGQRAVDFPLIIREGRTGRRRQRIEAIRGLTIARFQGLGAEAPRTQPQTAHLHGPAREPRLDAAAPSSLGLYHPGNEETKENHPESQRVRLQERHIKCQIKNELEE